MVNRAKTDLAGRISQYVNKRRRASKNEGDFGEALANKASDTRAQKVTPKAVASSSRRKTPQSAPRRSARYAARQARTRHYKKHITMIQAKRLAHYAPVIQQASRKYRVPIELICGVILQESGGKYKAVSHCGARGLMQLMPATAKRLGVSNSFDPAQNIMGGTKYLRMLLNRFDGNVALALAGYNAGEGNVEKYGRKIPPFKETQAYVPNVLKYADTLWRMMRVPVRRINVVRTRPSLMHRTIYTRRA